MARVRVECPSTSSTVGGVTFTISTGWADVADANASGGHYTQVTGSPGTMSITIPVGYSAVLIGGTAASFVASMNITVDGVLEGRATQYCGTTNNATGFVLYRTTYHPIMLNPTISHTILLDSVSNPFNVDFIDLFTPDANPLNTLLGAFGHSIVAGGYGSGFAAVNTTTRFTAQVAASLGLGEYNVGSPGESLSFWSNPSSVPTVPDNSTGTANIYGGILEGWKRIDAYTYVATGAFAGTYSPWENLSPTVEIFMEALNDLDFGPHGATPDPNIALGLTPLYYPERYEQRLREAIWRMMLSCPKTLLVICGLAPTMDLTAPDSEKVTWNSMIAGVCAEPTMNAYPLYVDVWTALQNGISGPPRMASVYPNSLYFDALHPNAAGHALIARAIVDAIRARRTPPMHRLGIW